MNVEEWFNCTLLAKYEVPGPDVKVMVDWENRLLVLDGVLAGSGVDDECKTEWTFEAVE